MRMIAKKEQKNITGGVGLPPGPFAFAGIAVVAVGTVLLSNNNATNISTYVNSFFYNLTNNPE